MVEPQNIEGLPAGAQVKPLGGGSAPNSPANVEGLPAGAKVKPLGPMDGVNSDTVQQANPTHQPSQESDLSRGVVAAGEGIAGAARGFGKTVMDTVQTVAAPIKRMNAAVGLPDLEKPPINTDLHGVAEHIGGGLESLGEFALGDEVLKGMSLAEKAKHVSLIANFMEKYPRLAKAVGMGMRQGAVGGVQGAAHGDTAGEAAVHGVENAGMYWMLHGTGKLAGALFGKLPPTTAAEATQTLTNALNPAPEHMPKFRGDMGRQLGRIVDYAQRNKIDLAQGGRKALLDTMHGAAEESQQFYDKYLLEPLKDKMSAGGEHTYGELEARLRHLNRTTSYAPTTAAESEAQLARKAEAISLRRTLNEGIAKEFGVKPEQVAQARSAAEQLRDMADKSQLAWDIEQHATNAQERSSVTLHASSHGGAIPGTPVSGGRVSAAMTKGANRALGHPSDNAINKVFSRLKLETGEVPLQASHAPTLQEQPTGNRFHRFPKARQEQGAASVSVGSTANDFRPDMERARELDHARQQTREVMKPQPPTPKAHPQPAWQKKESDAAVEALQGKTRMNGSSESDASLEAVHANKADRAAGIKYVIKTRGGSERPVMATELRPEDVRRNPGETLWKKHPDGRMERVN